MLCSVWVYYVHPPFTFCTPCPTGVVLKHRYQSDRDRVSTAVNKVVSDFGGGNVGFLTGLRIRFGRGNAGEHGSASGYRWDVVSASCKQAQPYLKRYDHHHHAYKDLFFPPSFLIDVFSLLSWWW